MGVICVCEMCGYCEGAMCAYVCVVCVCVCVMRMRGVRVRVCV